ncbi:DUF2407 C-terminal domain-containing protein [Hypoxylon trugodes]|uniref:DUF2407 C-terminal domain-containing protein n=1 Tax=Hypoxylon trugodes TaxID=326681 RepID=UPI00219B1D82|nr:DUF2407 C-terminal domain-containing protein [Hypoxylon trugodes]KAI1388227.1 DUF2407 C-terminal domain-containing protein [Hypoxylon trugodes]
MTTSPRSSQPLHLKPPIPPPPSQPPLLLTIRFSASIPDLELDIPRPSSTTVISLKHLIRARLSEPNSQRRLRFIHGGKILPDSAVLSSVLRAPPPPPPSSPLTPSYGHSYNDSKGNDGKGKGKSIPGRPDPTLRIYVNCSIGDSLTTTELEAEALAASAAPPPLSPSPTTTAYPPLPGTPQVASTTTAPRGFDRLLSTGFTTAEVNQLRLQFRSVHASRYTPDTLPSPDSFRRMEDAWIDDNGAAAAPTTATTTATFGGGTDSDEVGLVALVDVMIRGVLTGFVWPLGSAGWLVREEGMASGRWRFMVGVGVVFSLLIGIIRSISGEK